VTLPHQHTLLAIDFPLPRAKAVHGDNCLEHLIALLLREPGSVLAVHEVLFSQAYPGFQVAVLEVSGSKLGESGRDPAIGLSECFVLVSGEGDLLIDEFEIRVCHVGSFAGDVPPERV
jgi:hypothetical protein